MIETRDGSGNVLMQVIHGTRYIDEVVQLFLQDAGRVYVHQDANYNVTTLTDITGRVLERSFYSPYGQLEAVISNHPFDYDDDGDVDANDASVCLACSGDYVGDCRLLDADGDRDVDYDDQTIIDAYVAGLSGDTRWTRVPSRPRSRLGNPFAHQGLPLDAEIASYQNRARQYNPGLKRFVQRDPQGLQDRRDFFNAVDRSGPQVSPQNDPTAQYSDGLSTYQFARARPIASLDPFGLECWSCTQLYDVCMQTCTSTDGGTAEPLPHDVCHEICWPDHKNKQACPATNPGRTNGDCICSEGKNPLHPEAQECFRGLCSPGVGDKQCCYDPQGCLICDGHPGAGTWDNFSPAWFECCGKCVPGPIGIIGHFVCDML